MANANFMLDPFGFMIQQNRPHPDPKRFNHGWRTDMLAIPKCNKKELETFGLSQEQIARMERAARAKRGVESDERKKRWHNKIMRHIDAATKDWCLAPVRVYQTQRQMWKDIRGKKFDQKMKHFIQEAKNSVYHEYDRARLKMKKEGKGKGGVKGKHRKSGKGKGKKRTKAEIRAAALANVSNLATPKKPARPEKISRGKHGEMSPATMDRLCQPKFYTPKYVDDSMIRWRDEHYVPIDALTYEPSPRIYELAVHKVYPFEPLVVLGAVDPEALVARASPRIIEMAVPKPRSAVQEADYNEDAFKISPNALRYKATERIIELAKPIERD